MRLLGHKDRTTSTGAGEGAAPTLPARHKRRWTLRAAAVLGATSLLTAGTVTLTTSSASAAPYVGYIGPSARTPGYIFGTPEGIKCVQKAVGVAEDGQFGPATFEAIKRLQASAGVQVDGTVGPITGDMILLAVGYNDFFRCYEYVPSTYTLDPNDGAVAMGGGLLECSWAQIDNVYKDAKKIFGLNSNLSHVVRATAGRGWSTTGGMVKCIFLGP